jgi:hypothetical protein
VGVEVQLHTFLTPKPDGDDCSASRLAILFFACAIQEAVQAQGIAKIYLKHPYMFRGICIIILSFQHTGNANIGITTTRLSRLYMQPPNKQLPCVEIINVLQTVFYHSTTIT